MRPDEAQSQIAAALQALQRGDVARAEAAAANVLRVFPREPTSLMIAGLAAQARGNPHAALEFLTRADAAAPRNPMILGNLGVVYRALGRLEDARSAYDAALSLNPKHFPTRANLARLLDQMGRLDEAETQFRTILAVKTDHPEALGGLAAVLEQRHRLDEAENIAVRAGALPVALLTRAKIAIRAKRHDDALARIAELRAQSLTPVNAALADGLEGQARELMGDFDAAFAAFARANETLRVYYAPQFDTTRSLASPDVLPDLAKEYSGAGMLKVIAPDAAGQRDGHTFLLGFPRSGTTLLEQALAAHPDVQSLEERDTLVAALTAMVDAPSIPEFCASLTPARLDVFRADYWTRVAKEFGAAPHAKVFIDKMPINAAYLGVIAALFPSARILFAIRDPRDVLLSCYQQRFGMNAVMYQFLNLDSAARLYDGVMTAAMAARAALPLNLHEIRYERLTADFEGELARAVAFLGLEWSPSLLDFRTLARDRYVSTPSAAQVMEPVTQSAVGRFRRYERHLAPIMPVANAWAARFGYATS